MWELDYKESWAPKNWCFWTVEIQPVHPKGDQSWVFIAKTDVDAETPILWPPDAKNWLIWKDPDAGKDWRQEEKWMRENEMIGWHQQLNGHEFGWTLGIGDGQGGLICCSPQGHKESDMTELLNWTYSQMNRTWDGQGTKSQTLIQRNSMASFVTTAPSPRVLPAETQSTNYRLKGAQTVCGLAVSYTPSHFSTQTHLFAI